MLFNKYIYTKPFSDTFSLGTTLIKAYDLKYSSKTMINNIEIMINYIVHPFLLSWMETILFLIVITIFSVNCSVGL